MNPTESLNADLNKTIGVLEDGRNVLVHFKRNVDSSVNLSIEPNKFIEDKKKKGLSKGAIAGIVIAAAVVLIAAIVIIILLLKRSTTPPPKQNLGNTNVKIENNSSTNVMNN